MRLARVEVVPDESTANETPVVVRVGEFRVEVSGDFSSETLAAVLDVLEGLQVPEQCQCDEADSSEDRLHACGFRKLLPVHSGNFCRWL
ncbi:MAG: hypothetical protein AB1938_30735 [Myxococcota bacterium]